MGSTALVLLVSFLVAVNLLPAARSDTAHDMLPKYGLPRGLLPDNVKSYSVAADGSFVVEFNSPCYVHFSRLVYFEQKITGKISYGKITDITGIQAKKLFVWVSLTGMVAKKDAIEFQVGFLSETLPISEFEEVHPCKAKVGGCRGFGGVLGQEKAAAAALDAEV